MRTSIVLRVLLAALTILSACLPVAARGTGKVSNEIIVYGGIPRRYRLYQPSKLASPSSPLVFVLHGGGLGSPDQVATDSHFDGQAERDGFLAVYPEGVGRTWNAGTCCGPAQRLNVDDVGFIRKLIDAISARYPVDPGRVFATGISNGGMMAYRLACDLSDRIAAIGPVAASMLVPCHPPRRVSVIHIHGLQDRFVPYDGGVGPRSISRDSRPSVPSVIQRWREIDGCPGPPTVDRDPPVTRTASLGCGEGTAVVLYTIDNAGHVWPGGRTSVVGAALFGSPSNAIDATSVIAAFFAGHGR